MADTNVTMSMAKETPWHLGVQSNENLFMWISDDKMALFVFPIFFWIFASVFGAFEWLGIFQKYRLRTPSEAEKLNRKVGPWRCAANVLMNQGIGIATGLGVQRLAGTPPTSGIWEASPRWIAAGTIRCFELVGIDVGRVAEKSFSISIVDLEKALAASMGMYLIPCLQLLVALFVSDTWQYFVHRWCHSNKFMYRNVHSIHHQLYAPYAFGGQYVHPIESLLLDTISSMLSLYASALSTRLGMFFAAYYAFKYTFDHCGYVLPWGLFMENDTFFHDIHHQPWGLKSNFAVHFLFWDWLFGTLWTDKQAALRNYRQSNSRLAEVEEKKPAKLGPWNSKEYRKQAL